MKKGFTLIELLAVIIILAIIALIATPIILRVIENAQREAAGRSVEGYAAAVNLARIEFMFENNMAEPTAVSTTEVSGGANTTAQTINYSGAEVTCTFGNPVFDEGILQITQCSVSGFTCVWNDRDGATRCARGDAPAPVTP